MHININRDSRVYISEISIPDTFHCNKMWIVFICFVFFHFGFIECIPSYFLWGLQLASAGGASIKCKKWLLITCDCCDDGIVMVAEASSCVMQSGSDTETTADYLSQSVRGEFLCVSRTFPCIKTTKHGTGKQKHVTGRRGEHIGARSVAWLHLKSVSGNWELQLFVTITRWRSG